MTIKELIYQCANSPECTICSKCPYSQQCDVFNDRFDINPFEAYTLVKDLEKEF